MVWTNYGTDANPQWQDDDPYEGYTISGVKNPLTGIAALTYDASNHVNPSFNSPLFNPQPGFIASTTSTGSMGYNIPSAGQGVSSYPIGESLSTDMSNPFQDYLPQEFLETSPSAAYYSSPTATDFYTRPSGTVDPSKKKFYQESFQDIYNEYLGKLGTQAREGETPDLKFTDYLSQASPFTERYDKLTPYQRGQSTRASAPTTRFIYY